ncbi:hypothetical protein FHG87_023046 [Trinorchestia longiramus]|nr:hypothetical protein FHG87_023046 [Trinorchestia longiramus]
MSDQLLLVGLCVLCISLLMGGLVLCYFYSLRAMWRGGARSPRVPHPEITQHATPTMGEIRSSFSKFDDHGSFDMEDQTRDDISEDSYAERAAELSAEYPAESTTKSTSEPPTQSATELQVESPAESSTEPLSGSGAEFCSEYEIGVTTDFLDEFSTEHFTEFLTKNAAEKEKFNKNFPLILNANSSKRNFQTNIRENCTANDNEIPSYGNLDTKFASNSSFVAQEFFAEDRGKNNSGKTFSNYPSRKSTTRASDSESKFWIEGANYLPQEGSFSTFYEGNTFSTIEEELRRIFNTNRAKGCHVVQFDAEEISLLKRIEQSSDGTEKKWELGVMNKNYRNEQQVFRTVQRNRGDCGRHSQGDYFKGNYGQGEWGQVNDGHDDYGQGTYGHDDYGLDTYDHDDYGLCDYGHGEYDRYGFSRGVHGRGNNAHDDYGQGNVGRNNYDSAAVSPSQAPAVSPNQAPAVSPNQAPAVSPRQAPAVSPRQAPAVSPRQAPAVSPNQAPAATESHHTSQLAHNQLRKIYRSDVASQRSVDILELIDDIQEES